MIKAIVGLFKTLPEEDSFSMNRAFYWWLLAISLLLPAIFFAPFLLSERPERLFFGDTQNLYFPQFVNSYYLTKQGIFTGVDMLTNNGASAYFLRPNIPTYYPINFILYMLPLNSISGLAKAFVLGWYIQTVLAFYFSGVVAKRFFSMNRGASLFLAVSYALMIARSTCEFDIFFMVASSFPMVLYASLTSLTVGLKSARLWILSVPFVLMFLAGYLPMAVHAVVLSSVFALLYYVYITRELGEKRSLLRLVNLGIPPFVASVVVVTLYLSIVQYHKQVLGVPEGVWFAAHEFAYSLQDFMALWSQGFLPKPSETPHVILKLSSLLILAMLLVHRRLVQFGSFDGKLMIVSFIVFIVHIFLSLGAYVGITDVFYYIAPGIGKMHWYGRFLLVAVFFFFICVAIGLNKLVSVCTQLPIERWLFCLVMLFAIILGLTACNKLSNYLSVQYLGSEVLLLMVCVLAFATTRIRYQYVAFIAVSFFVSVVNFHSKFHRFNDTNPEPYHDSTTIDTGKALRFTDYLKKYSSKTFIKFADLTSSIEKLKGINLNYPWLAQKNIKISNYMGYELHTSVDKNYIAHFPFYGKIDADWLLRTGADYLVFDDEAWKTHEQNLGQWIDRSVPQLELGEGIKVVKLKDAAGLIPERPTKQNTDFDNGLVRVTSSNNSLTVSNFETNYANFLSFETQASSEMLLQLQFFPMQMMSLYVDDMLVNKRGNASNIKNGLLQISIPAGKHKIAYHYDYPLHAFFVKIFKIYWLLLSALILVIALKKAVRILKRNSLNRNKEQTA